MKREWLPCNLPLIGLLVSGIVAFAQTQASADYAAAVLADNLGEELQSLDNLSEDIEPAHIRLPVLVRQYLKLNARFISFNVDPNFSDVLDGFIILDLNDVPYAMIEALKKESGT